MLSDRLRGQEFTALLLPLYCRSRAVPLNFLLGCLRCKAPSGIICADSHETMTFTLGGIGNPRMFGICD